MSEEEGGPEPSTEGDEPPGPASPLPDTPAEIPAPEFITVKDQARQLSAENPPVVPVAQHHGGGIEVLSPHALGPATGAPQFFEVHPVVLPRALVDRTVESRVAAEKLRRDGTRVLAIVAVGGEGKSTFVKQLVDRDRESFTIFTFSLAAAPDIELAPESFFAEACRLLLPNSPTLATEPPHIQSRALSAALDQQRVIVVLNEFENVLVQDVTDPRHAHSVSRELKDFLSMRLASQSSASKVIVTSRIVPIEFSDRAGYERYELPRLSDPAALRYLRLREIRGTDQALIDVANKYFNHVLSLGALADYLIRSQWGGDVAGAGSLQAIPENSRLEALRSILSSYEQLLTGPERQIVLTAAVASDDLSPQALADVLRIRGVLSDPNELDRLLVVLADTVLIGYDEVRRGRTIVTTHMLIGEYFMRIAPDAVAATRRALVAYYTARMPEGVAQSLAGSRPAIAAFRQYIALQEFQQALELYTDRLGGAHYLFASGHYRMCAVLTNALIEAHERDQIDLPGDVSASLYLRQGCVIAKTATVDRAVERFDHAARLATAGSRQRVTAILYAVEALIEGARCHEARSRLQRAEVGGALRNAYDHETRGRMGYLAAILGETDAALTNLGMAITGAEQSGAFDYACLFLRVRADLYVRHERLDEAQRDIDAGLAIARGTLAFLDYEGHLVRTTGDRFMRAGRETAAREAYAQALVIARGCGYRWLEAETLIGLGHLALAGTEDADEVGRLAEYALDIAREGGWWLEDGRAKVLLGHASLLQGETDAAAWVDAAVEIARRSGHHLLMREAMELEAKASDQRG